MTPKKSHLTRFCNHPAIYTILYEGGGRKNTTQAHGWCKYCRMKVFGGSTLKEIEEEVARDKDKRRYRFLTSRVY